MITSKEIFAALTNAGVDTRDATVEMTGGGVATITLGPYAEEYSSFWGETDLYGSVLIGPGSFAGQHDSQFWFDELAVGDVTEPEAHMCEYVRTLDELIAATKATLDAASARRNA